MQETKTKSKWINVIVETCSATETESVRTEHLLAKEDIFEIASISGFGVETQYFLYNRETKERLFGEDDHSGFTLFSEEEMSEYYTPEPSKHLKMEATLEKETERIIRDNLFYVKGFLVMEGLQRRLYFIGIDEGDFGIMDYQSWIEKD